MYKLCFYVPETHLEEVKAAVFETGAGRIGDYDSCCWQVAGEGQFRPLSGSDPFLGEQGNVERVVEYRVELVCDEQSVRPAIAALYRAHPYEEPAWDAIALANPTLR
jgi:hypothetical protein